MVTIVTSKFGCIVIENESFIVYSTEEIICDERGIQTTEEAEGVRMFVADLVFETATAKYVFPKLFLGLDYALIIREMLNNYNGEGPLIIDLDKVVDFLDEPEMIGSKSIVAEYK